MPKNWARGLTTATDDRVRRAAQSHIGMKYQRRTPIAQCKFSRGSTLREGPIGWTAATAYLVGLTATDGCLLSRKTTIDITSGDREMVETFLRCAGRPDVRVRLYAGKKSTIYRGTFGDVELYRWLQAAGLTPRKSLTLGPLRVPTQFLSHVMRGLIDGDGSIDCYVHNPIKKINPNYRYQRLSVRFLSASRAHCVWVQEILREHLQIVGALLRKHGRGYSEHDLCNVKYGKYASIRLLTWMYEGSEGMRLERKYVKWSGFVERERAGDVLYRRKKSREKTLRALPPARNET